MQPARAKDETEASDSDLHSAPMTFLQRSLYFTDLSAKASLSVQGLARRMFFFSMKPFLIMHDESSHF